MHDIHMNDVLERLVTKTPNIAGAAVIHEDGQVIACRLPPNFNESRISATVAAILPCGMDLAAALKCGRLDQLMFIGEIGQVLLRGTGPQVVLCTLAGPAVHLETLLMATGHAAASITRLLPYMSTAAPPPAARSSETPYKAIGFTEADQILVTRIWPYIRPALPGLTERLYQMLEADPQMAALIAGRVETLKRTQLIWLESLFAGDYGPNFIRRQENIGKAHLRAGVRPVFFATSMAFLRSAFPPALRACVPDTQTAEAAAAAALRLLTFCQQIIDGNYGQALTHLDEAVPGTDGHGFQG
ncbi:MAG: protoglobin domain-containing protein [Acidocella sp.]